MSPRRCGPWYAPLISVSPMPTDPAAMTGHCLPHIHTPLPKNPRPSLDFLLHARFHLASSRIRRDPGAHRPRDTGERPVLGHLWVLVLDNHSLQGGAVLNGVSLCECRVAYPCISVLMCRLTQMFTTAIVSIILYGLMFLRLRGNIDGVGLRITFCRARQPWQSDTNMSDPQIARVGKTMLLYVSVCAMSPRTPTVPP